MPIEEEKDILKEALEGCEERFLIYLKNNILNELQRRLNKEKIDGIQSN